jgi:choline dehydrogenase-like flavoprotein
MPGMTQADVLVADVLVVGAGPTGLTLACDLARRGVAVRIVDRAPEFPRGSRGKGLSPRSLEVLDDLGLIDQLLKAGVTHLPHRKYLFDVFRGPHFTLLGLGELSAPALGRLGADIVKPYLIGPGGLVDDGGHVARAYGEDVLVLVRPDGYVGLIADAGDASAVASYVRSL